MVDDDKELSKFLSNVIVQALALENPEKTREIKQIRKWVQSDDGWLNLWRCHEGSAQYVRTERDGAPMKESTAYTLVEKCCRTCPQRETCSFYYLYK